MASDNLVFYDIKLFKVMHLRYTNEPFLFLQEKKALGERKELRKKALGERKELRKKALG